MFAQEELVKFGNFDSWITRSIKESVLVGGKTQTLYEVGPKGTFDGARAYTNQGGSPWANSNVYAKVAGVVKTNVSVYPDKADVNHFFTTLKQGNEEQSDQIRGELAQKYYAYATSHPESKVDLFSTKGNDVDLSAIQRVSIIQTKGNPSENEPRKILCFPVIDGMDKVKGREVSPAQYQRLWLAEDKEAYKLNLAAALFADLLKQKTQKESEKKQEEQKRENSPEQKAREEREEKAKEALTKAETGLVAGIVAGGIVKDQMEEHSRGFHR